MQRSTKNDYLKIIAIITMLIDHIGYIFFPKTLVFRMIGRIAFPIYAYSIAAGYKHTSNRLKYAQRLFVFALISYVPYIYFNPLIEPQFYRFNVIFLLLAGLGAIAIWDRAFTRLTQGSQTGNNAQYFGGLLLLCVFSIYLFIPKIVSVFLINIGIDFALSYGTYGLFLIMIFYWFYDRPFWGICSFIILSFGDAFIGAYLAYGSPMWSLRSIAEFATTDWLDILNNDALNLSNFFFQTRAILGVILIYLLKPIDARLKLNKYVFYWFYPVHIVVIMLIYGCMNY